MKTDSENTDDIVITCAMQKITDERALKLARRINRVVRKNHTDYDEWWVSSSKETVIECAKEMLEAGMPYEQVERLVSSLISVGTSQYGG